MKITRFIKWTWSCLELFRNKKFSIHFETFGNPCSNSKFSKLFKLCKDPKPLLSHLCMKITRSIKWTWSCLELFHQKLFSIKTWTFYHGTLKPAITATIAVTVIHNSSRIGLLAPHLTVKNILRNTPNVLKNDSKRISIFMMYTEYYSLWRRTLNLSVISSVASNPASGRVGSIQSPWVSQRAQGSVGSSPIACVCSGIVFFGLGSFFCLGSLASLGSRECILQWQVPGKAPFLQGVPFPVTPWHGSFFLFWVVLATWRSRSSATSSRSLFNSSRSSSIVMKLIFGGEVTGLRLRVNSKYQICSHTLSTLY